MTPRRQDLVDFGTLRNVCWSRCRTCSCGPCRCWGRPPPEFAGRATPSGSAAVYSDPCGPRACPARAVPTTSTIPAAPGSNVLTASSPSAAWPAGKRGQKQEMELRSTITLRKQTLGVRRGIGSEALPRLEIHRTEINAGRRDDAEIRSDAKEAKKKHQNNGHLLKQNAKSDLRRQSVEDNRKRSSSWESTNEPVKGTRSRRLPINIPIAVFAQPFITVITVPSCGFSINDSC